MQLILLEKVSNLGNLGDVVNVKSGYGRNYLVPQGKAAFASKDNLAKFQERKAELEAKATSKLEHAHKRAEEIKVLDVIKISSHASDEGKLYGSVGAREISDVITSMGVELCKSEVLLPNGPIRSIGEHEVQLSVHTDIKFNVKVLVVGE
jgi:large subunit ribosomal protein L9